MSFSRRAQRALAVGLCVLHTVSCLEFDMMQAKKCIMEEINANVIVVGDYSGVSKSNPEKLVALNVKVEDPKGVVIYNQASQVSGQFAFTSKVSGDYKACFTAPDVETALDTKIRLDWKTGVAATDWEEIAKKENLDAMATELRKLEVTVKTIHNEMLHLRKREEEMRDLNEATNDRVAFFSIVSLCVCVVLAGWQLWHLRSFFHRKKIL